MADFYKNIDHFNNNDSTPELVGMEYEVIDDLTTEPVTPAFVKDHLRIDYNLDDTLLTVYITAARQYLEQYTQLSFGVKTIAFRALNLPDNYKLMYGKVDAITSGNYELFGDRIKKGGKDVELEYTTKGTIDDNIRNAIAMEAGSRYMIREGIPLTENGNSPGELKNLAKELLQNYRNVTI